MLIVCGKGNKDGGKRETQRQAIPEKEENCTRVKERWKSWIRKNKKLVDVIKSRRSYQNSNKT
jgi:hypothetical protein